jgi:Ribbon-helix-helix protein, copG family
MRLVEHVEPRMKRSSVWLSLSTFSAEALTGGDGAAPEVVVARLRAAIRIYLNVDDPGTPGWAVPRSLRGREPDDMRLELVADESLIEALEKEAAKQNVSVSQLARQAALFYAAEFDGGRITQQIAEEPSGEGA